MTTSRKRSLPQVTGLAAVAAVCAARIAWEAPQLWRAAQVVRLGAELKRRGVKVDYPIPHRSWILSTSLQAVAIPAAALVLVLFAVRSRRYWLGWLAAGGCLVWTLANAVVAFHNLLG